MRTSMSLFRVLIVGASITLAGWVASLVATKETKPAVTARTLQAALPPLDLPQPVFGPVLTEVHSAEDAVQTRSGWVVLDARAEQLVFLDSTGAFLSRTGRRGEGPGELMRSVAIALLDTTIVVAGATGTRLDFFSVDGTYQRRVRLDSPGCATAGVDAVLSGSTHLIVLRRCMRANGRTTVLLERVDFSGERTMLSERLLTDLRAREIDPTRFPMVTAIEERVYLGVSPDPCVQEVVSGAELATAYCHPHDLVIPVPDSLRAELRRLAPRFTAFGASLVVPERYPPFDAIENVGGQLAFRTLLDDRGRALDVVRGDRLERILLFDGSEIFPGARGLLLAREEPEGTTFAVLPLP
jgi:hypothetical protein